MTSPAPKPEKQDAPKPPDRSRRAVVISVVSILLGAFLTLKEHYAWPVTAADLERWEAPLARRGEWTGRRVRLTYLGLGERHAYYTKDGLKFDPSHPPEGHQRWGEAFFVRDINGRQVHALVILPHGQLPEGPGPHVAVGRVRRMSTSGVVLWQIGVIQETGAFFVDTISPRFRWRGLWGPLLVLGGLVATIAAIWRGQAAEALKKIRGSAPAPDAPDAPPPP